MSTPEIKNLLVGRVVSDKMAKTVTVLIERKVRDAVVGKVVVKSSKHHAHVEQEQGVGVGDIVSIRECRQRSKTKHWQVVEILEKAEIV